MPVVSGREGVGRRSTVWESGPKRGPNDLPRKCPCFRTHLFLRMYIQKVTNS